MDRLGLALPLAGALALGCGSDPLTRAPTPVTCAAPSYADPSLESQTIGRVTLFVYDLDGAPVFDTPVTVCGVDVCSNIQHTDDYGKAVVTLSSPLTKPALKYGDGLEHAELALLLEHDADADLTILGVHTPALPTEGSPIAAGARSESGGASLTLPSNATLTLDPLPPYDTEDSRAFRAAELAPDLIPVGLDHGAGLERVFTLAPLGAVMCPEAKLTLPNSAAWEPGTAVEFLVEGFGVGTEDGDQPYAPYGEWQGVATGVVDEQGESLVMTSGGLPIISNVGVRRL